MLVTYMLILLLINQFLYTLKTTIMNLFLITYKDGYSYRLKAGSFIQACTKAKQIVGTELLSIQQLTF